MFMLINYVIKEIVHHYHQRFHNIIHIHIYKVMNVNNTVIIIYKMELIHVMILVVVIHHKYLQCKEIIEYVVILVDHHYIYHYLEMINIME